jgi:TolB protein
MKPKSKLYCISIFAGLLLFIGLIPGPSPLLAQDVVVSLASPSNAPQGTANLNVRVIGKGFKKGAVAKWLVTGSETDLGGVTVNSTTYISATDLIANITVAAAKKFDIKVTLTSGRTGKGIERFTVTYNPPDPAIAFVAGYSKRNDLVVMNADGTNRMTILSQQLVEFQNPVWSPDGSQLAFCKFDLKASQSAIYVVNKDGSNLRKVNTPNNVRVSYTNKISWSPVPLADGQYKIAFSGYVGVATQSDILIVNLDGSGFAQLTNTPDIREWDVAWSPTADRIAVYAYNFVINNGLGSLPVYSVDYASGQFTATFLIDLMAVPGSPLTGDFWNPSWAKTQDKIVVSAPLTPGAGYYKIWVIDLANPANPTDLTPAPNIFNCRPSWSPDDSQIVILANYSSGPFGISVINSDGSGATQIAAPMNTFSYNGPDWRRCCPTCATPCAQ